MTASKPGAPNALSMRERAEIDTLFSRVRSGNHYTVLGISSSAAQEVVQKEYLRLTRWLDTVITPDRALAEYELKVSVVAAAIENAFRIVGNPRERLLYDQAHQRSERRLRPSRPTRARGAEAPPHGAAGNPPAAAPRPGPAKPSPATAPGPGPGNAREPSGRAADRHGAVPFEHGDQLVRGLLELLDVHLGAALGRQVSLRESAEGRVHAPDAVRFARLAERAEQAAQWPEATVLWHLAWLAVPDDSAMILRAATALRSAGGPQKLVDQYMRLIRSDGFGPPAAGGPPASQVLAVPEPARRKPR